MILDFGESSKVPLTLETEGYIKDPTKLYLTLSGTGLAIHNIYCTCRLHLTFLDNKSINQYIMEMFVGRTELFLISAVPGLVAKEI